ncbi:ABC transporter substrate-binding protein [Dermabacteraceae bacterium TAE3-ERU27]|nr:ABC transporter substrate-binding protein [Dermabacteraceae bacterium TAE3-ERU27]
MTTRHLSRRAMLLGTTGIAATLLASCGSDKKASDSKDAKGTEKAAASAGSGKTIEHNKGTYEVPAEAPKKVVLMDYAWVDTFETLGIPFGALPKKHLRGPAEEKYKADQWVDAGAFREPNLDAIASYGPDLIIVSGRSASQYDALKKITPNVIDVTPDAKDFIPSLNKHVTNVASIFGKEKEAKEKLDALNKNVEDTKQLIASKPGKGLLLMTSGGKATAFGPGARFGGLVHTTLGVPAVNETFADARHGDAVSFEYIAEANPQYLFVVDRDAAIGKDGQSAKQILDNPLVNKTDAWKNNKVGYLDGRRWYVNGNGLTAVNDMVNEVKAVYSA